MWCFTRVSILDLTGRLHTVITPIILTVLSIAIFILQTALSATCITSSATSVKSATSANPPRDVAMIMTDGERRAIESSCAADAHFVPVRGEMRGEKVEASYQYFPFVLLAQAALFCVSGILWSAFANGCSALPLQSIYKMALHAKNTSDPSSYKHAVENLAGHIYSATVDSCCNRLLLSFVRTLQNLVFAFHAILQMLLLSQVATGSVLLGCGLDWAIQYRRQGIPPEMALFPRMVLCNENSTSQWGGLECILHINIFQEKVIIFLWFWFLFLALMAVWTLTSSVASLTCSICPRNPDGRFVSRYLHARRLADSRRAAQRFTRELLGPDGVLALRGVSEYGGDLVTTDVMEALWNGAQPECVSPVVTRRGGPEDRDSNAETVQLTSVRYDDVDPYATDDMNLSMQKPLIYSKQAAGSPVRGENSYAV